MGMNEIDFKEFYDKAGRLNGWDFSKVQCLTEGVQWNFYEEVMNICRSTDVLLDIGTGGGENVLTIASGLQFIVGIDASSGMIETAHANLSNAKVSNLRFVEMDSEALQFPAGFFDVVSCRHAPFDAKEAARVLKDKGLFITQQVSEADKWNLMNFFERGSSLGKPDGALRDKYIYELKAAGFSKVECREYDAKEYYQRAEDLLFLLKHAPIIPGFGEDSADFKRLEVFVQSNQTNKGIVTNSKRFMLVARK
jgi:ubiquinone/menaquinone biosynthesis C-methylase UbiE